MSVETSKAGREKPGPLRLTRRLVVRRSARASARSAAPKALGAALAAALAIGSLGLAAPSALADPAPAPSMSLISQTPYLVGQGVFDLELGVRFAAGDSLRVVGYPSLDSRTQFEEAMNGHYGYYPIYQAQVPAGQLEALGDHVELTIPFGASANPTGYGGALPAFPVGYSPPSAVYPLQLQLLDPTGQAVGDPISTFLVYVAGDRAQTGYAPLAVALVLPVESSLSVSPKGQLEPLHPSASARLGALASAVASTPQVPVSLYAVPATLEALARSGPSGRQTLAELAQAVSRGDQLLPTTWGGRPPGQYIDQRAMSQLDQQVGEASQTLRDMLGSSPGQSTWVIDGPTDPATVAGLGDLGMRQVVLPEEDLQPLPAALSYNTFAYATTLELPEGQRPRLFAADSGLTADFSRQVPPVLGAEQMLAELDMIQLETPGYSRGVVVMPPLSWSEPAAFLSTLLAGMAGDPLLDPVTMGGLFAEPLQKQVVRTLAGDQRGAPSWPARSDLSPSALSQAAAQVAGIASILGGRSEEISQANTDLALAQSPLVSSRGVARLLGAISGLAESLRRQVTLPAPSSITLTASHTQVPLTVLSAPALRARVKLVISSERLIFSDYRAPGVSCSELKQVTEVCQMVLVSQNTTLRLPVQSRAPGEFPLTVSLYSADGSLLLARRVDSVRSTAFSQLGLVLVVVILAALALWWARDLRRGRRARRLVPSPFEAQGLEFSHPDPSVEAFFASSPPAVEEPSERKSGV